MIKKITAFTIYSLTNRRNCNEIEEETMNKYPIIPWSSIRGMRNRIIHDYENIDLSVLWGIIKESLPELKDKLKDILLSNRNDSI